MNSGFLKEAGAYIVALLLGSVTIHGLLYFLVKDANGLIGEGGMWPLALVLILYGLLPLVIIYIWRFFYKHDGILVNINTNAPAVKNLFVLEDIFYVNTSISIVAFTLYNLELLIENRNLFWLYSSALALGIISLACLVLMIFFLLQIKRSKSDKQEDTDNDKLAEVHTKNYRIEGYILSFLWVVGAAYIVLSILSPQLKTTKSSELKNIEAKFETSNNKFEKDENLNAKLSDVYHALLLIPVSEQSSKASFNRSTSKIDQNLYAIYKGDSFNFNVISDELDILKSDIKSAPALSKTEHQNLIEWIQQTENKLILLRMNFEGEMASHLKVILAYAQNYFLIIFWLFILLGLFYWVASNTAYKTALELDNTENTIEPYKEIEFSKFYLTLAFVLLIPLLKPMEQQEIQFNKPLWTLTPVAVQRISNPAPQVVVPPANSSVSISFNDGKIHVDPKQDSITLQKFQQDIENLNIELTKLGDEYAKSSKTLNQISIEISEIKNADSVDLSEVLSRIESIRKELDRAKKR